LFLSRVRIIKADFHERFHVPGCQKDLVFVALGNEQIHECQTGIGGGNRAVLEQVVAACPKACTSPSVGSKAASLVSALE
jgi:hypothetical protein